MWVQALDDLLEAETPETRLQAVELLRSLKDDERAPRMILRSRYVRELIGGLGESSPRRPMQAAHLALLVSLKEVAPELPVRIDGEIAVRGFDELDLRGLPVLGPIPRLVLDLRKPSKVDTSLVESLRVHYGAVELVGDGPVRLELMQSRMEKVPAKRLREVHIGYGSTVPEFVGGTPEHVGLEYPRKLERLPAAKRVAVLEGAMAASVEVPAATKHLFLYRVTGVKEIRGAERLESFVVRQSDVPEQSRAAPPTPDAVRAAFATSGQVSLLALGPACWPVVAEHGVLSSSFWRLWRFYSGSRVLEAQEAFVALYMRAPKDANLESELRTFVQHGGDEKAVLAEIEDALRSEPRWWQQRSLARYCLGRSRRRAR